MYIDLRFDTLRDEFILPQSESPVPARLYYDTGQVKGPWEAEVTNMWRRAEEEGHG